MRLLVAIPHYFKPTPGHSYGSMQPESGPRVEALRNTLLRLCGLRASAQFAYKFDDRLVPTPFNTATAHVVDIVICTTNGCHILDELNLPVGLFTHKPTEADPQYLGLECRSVLRENLGQEYDYFCYLEDDLLVHDSSFFQKLDWFGGRAGDGAVLQPNRYELSFQGGVRKVYIDFDAEPLICSAPGHAHNFEDQITFSVDFCGRNVSFTRAGNPHSGCFFLRRAQMQRWAEDDQFLYPDRSFWGPLESSATLGLIRAFRIYKPAPANANFLEIQHCGEAWSRLLPNIRFRTGSVQPPR